MVEVYTPIKFSMENVAWFIYEFVPLLIPNIGLVLKSIQRFHSLFDMLNLDSSETFLKS